VVSHFEFSFMYRDHESGWGAGLVPLYVFIPSLRPVLYLDAIYFENSLL
jgi:hypothetical protein